MSSNYIFYFIGLSALVEFIVVLMVLTTPSFLAVMWMYSLFNLLGAFVSTLIICLAVGLLYIVYSEPVLSQGNELGIGVYFVRDFLLPPVAAGAILGLFFCFWRSKRASLSKF